MAAALRGTRYAGEVERIADGILSHRFPILGLTVDTGPTIDWRRDYLHQVTSGTPYFRRSPYLDFSRVGDHKVIWELNRHQHLTLLAQAFLLTGRREYLDEAFRQIESWLDANPFLRGNQLGERAGGCLSSALVGMALAHGWGARCPMRCARAF